MTGATNMYTHKVEIQYMLKVASAKPVSWPIHSGARVPSPESSLERFGEGTLAPECIKMSYQPSRFC